MESKGKYVWDPEQQAWVRPTGPKTGEDAAKPSEPIKEVKAQPERDTAHVEADTAQGTIEVEAEAGYVEYKGALIRLAGIIVDFIVLMIINVLIDFIYGRVTGTETVANGAEEAVINLPEWVSVIIGFVYFVGLWTWRGQSLGKMLVKAKIVKADGSRIGPINAVLRFAFYLIPTFAPLLYLANIVNGYIPLVGAIVGFAIIALTADKRGLHDMVAGTYVVDSRPAEPLYEEVEAEESAD